MIAENLPLPPISPAALLLADRHRNIEEVLADVEDLARRRSFLTASKRFGELYRAFEQHANAEEVVWLPRIEQRWPERKAEVEVVRAEHLALREQMEQVSRALTAWQPDESVSRLAELRALIEAHHAREEAEIYPAVVALHATMPR